MSVQTETGKKTFVEVQTPSGIEIRYHWEPERKYEIRLSPHTTNYSGLDDIMAAMVLYGEWREVPGVTDVLSVLDKPGLPWWGMQTAVKGFLQLQHYPQLDWNTLKLADPEEIIRLLTEHKLTVNHVRDEASARGLAVHAALEAWAENGIIPEPSIFPHTERPYVEGVVAFLEAIQPAVDTVESEVIVGSIEHGYCGRYDLRIITHTPVDVAYKWTPKRGPKLATLQPGAYLLDLKTSKRVYNSHFRQLAAYELASRECGYEPTTAQGVLHVTDYGGYSFVRSLAEPEDFLVSLALYKSEQQLKDKMKERK